MKTTARKMVPLGAWVGAWDVVKLQQNGMVFCHVMRMRNVWVKLIWKYFFKMRVSRICIIIMIIIYLFHLDFRLHTSCITCPSVWLEALSVFKPKGNAMRNSSWCYLKLIHKTVFWQPKFFHVVQGYKWYTHNWLKTRLSLDGQGLLTNQKEINAKRSRCKHTFQPNCPIAINWKYYHSQNHSNMWALCLQL